ncbi:MAG TPA: L,D-transpeptidase [Actinospica sp.]|nr:L,D-transpeptidase [Actinospica sp.]
MGKGTRAAGTGTRRRADAPAGPAHYQGPQNPQGPQGGPPAPPRSVGRPKSGRGATFSVLMMTLAALAAVGVLAAQAEATAPKVRATGTSASARAGGSKSGTGSTSSNSTALPANSGSGNRIVYSPSAHRVWLVQGSSTVERTMQVVPGTVSAPAGTYTVYGKSPGSVGGDGVTVLYVVKFDSGSSTSVGFDAESGVTGLPPAPTGKTGGIRMTQLDAQALFTFASVGTTVVVL